MKLVQQTRPTDAPYPPGTRLWVLARKSTAQHGDPEDRSNARQTENSRRFAETRLGLTFDPTRVCADENVSGADTHKAKGRARLFAEARRGDVVVMRDRSRFSRRDGDESFGELKQLAQRGIDVYFYETGQRFKYGTFADNVMGVIDGEKAADYRRQIALWVHESHAKRAREGKVSCGPRYGYQNVRRGPGHVDRVIDEPEAEIVRRIYRRALEGAGVKRIARELEADRIRTRSGRTWAGSVLRGILSNPLYRGEAVWNTSHKRGAKDVNGNDMRMKADESEVIRFRNENWRIVNDVTWYTVQKRFTTAQGRRRAVGAVFPQSSSAVGVRRRDRESNYMLTGFARCDGCGRFYAVHNRPTANKGPSAPNYRCRSYRKDCHNNTCIPVDLVEREIVQVISTLLNRPTLEADIIARVRAELKPRTDDTAIKREIATLERQHARLTEALAEGRKVGAALKEREERIALLSDRLKATPTETVTDIEARVRRELKEWRLMFGKGGVQSMRRFFAECLVEPLRIITPRRAPHSVGTRALEFVGRVDTRCFTGLVKMSHKGATTGRTDAMWHLPFKGRVAA